MLDRWVSALNKINSQLIVLVMFFLGAVIAIIAARMHNLTDKAQIELFGIASALVTGGLGMLNGNNSNRGGQRQDPASLPDGSKLIETSTIQTPPLTEPLTGPKTGAL